MKRERLWSVMVGLQTHGLETKFTVPMTVIAYDEREANERAKKFCADVRASGDRLTLGKSRPIDPADYLLNHLPAGSGAAMSDHTPGPWEYRSSKGFGWATVVCPNESKRVPKIVATVAPVDDLVDCSESGESLANGALIAAAPDLLAAIERYNAIADAWREGRIAAKDVARSLLEVDHECGRPAIAKVKGGAA